MRREDLKVGRDYRNIKTRDVYRIIGYAQHTEDDRDLLVLYHPVNQPMRIDDGPMSWARPLWLFLEKFERLPEVLLSDENGYPPLEVMDELKETPYWKLRTNPRDTVPGEGGVYWYDGDDYDPGDYDDDYIDDPEF